MLLAIKYEQPHIVPIVLAGGATPLSPTVDAQVRHVVAANKGDLFALRQQLARGAKVNERTSQARAQEALTAVEVSGNIA
jgi:hypothetical protein